MFPYANYSNVPYILYFFPNSGSLPSSANPSIGQPSQMNQAQRANLSSGINFQNQKKNLEPKGTAEQEKKKETMEEKGEEKKSQISNPKVDKKEDLKKTIPKTKDQQNKKRPLTYLTERAYYMKQKIKGRSQGDRRILRKRDKKPTRKQRKCQPKKEAKIRQKIERKKKDNKKNLPKKTKQIKKEKEKEEKKEGVEFAFFGSPQIGKMKFKEYLEDVRIDLRKRIFEAK